MRPQVQGPKPSVPPVAASGLFQGELLELVWRYAYRSEFVPLLLTYLGARPGMQILEVGCGSGFLTRLLLRNLDGVRITALDGDLKMLELAGQMLDREGHSAHAQLGQANAYELPFAGGYLRSGHQPDAALNSSDAAQGLREQVRVAQSGGTVSAVACFCHSGGLTRYHGRYPLSGNHRIDQLDVKVNRICRQTVRPRQLGVDHSILNLDLAWHFRNAGLQDVQINGHLALVSPGDARFSVEEGAAYATARHQIELDGIDACVGEWHGIG